MKRKNLIALILSVLVALTVFTCISLPAIAEENTPVTVLTVNGIDLLKADNKTVTCGIGTAAFDGKNTLTLSDAVISSCYDVTDEKTEAVSSYGVFATGDLDVVFSGNNTIDSSANKNSFALFVNGNVDVEGKGTLNLKSSNVPFYSAGSIDIEGKDTVINVAQSAVSTDETLCASITAKNDIDIKDATVDVKAYSDAVSAKSFELSKCIFTATATVASIKKISSGIVDVTEMKSEDTVFDCKGISNAVTVKNGDLTVDGGSFNAQATKALSNPSYDGVSVNNGKLIIKSGAFTASGDEAGAIVYSVFSTEEAAKEAKAAIIVDEDLAIATGGEIKTTTNVLNRETSYIVATSFSKSEIRFVDNGDGSISGGASSVKIASKLEANSDVSDHSGDASPDSTDTSEHKIVITTKPTTTVTAPDTTTTTSVIVPTTELKEDETTTVVVIDENEVTPDDSYIEEDIIPIAQTGDNAAYWLIPLGAVAVIVIVVICVTRKKGSDNGGEASDEN